jgi:hypothetical protein
MSCIDRIPPYEPISIKMIAVRLENQSRTRACYVREYYNRANCYQIMAMVRQEQHIIITIY